MEVILSVRVMKTVMIVRKAPLVEKCACALYARHIFGNIRLLGELLNIEEETVLVDYKR